MAIPISELIKKLEQHDQAIEVEYLVVKTDGELVTMGIEGTSRELTKVLDLFGAHKDQAA